MTKTQQKRMYMSILSKAKKLYFGNFADYGMSTKDYIAIEAIVSKYLKKMR